MQTAREYNFDGLVGPSHNYAGLSFGNVASSGNVRSVSNPKLAALQGLAKMRALAARGFGQALLPPHGRPDFRLLRSLGFSQARMAVEEGVLFSVVELSTQFRRPARLDDALEVRSTVGDGALFMLRLPLEVA